MILIVDPLQIRYISDINAWFLSSNLFNSTRRKYFANERVKKDKNDATTNRNK